MNVRYRTSAATTSSIHPRSLIHSSFVVRRTSSDYKFNFIHSNTLLLILLLSCCNHLCAAFEHQFDEVPLLSSLPSSRSSSTSSPNNKHGMFIDRNQNIPSSSSSDQTNSSSSSNYLDNLYDKDNLLLDSVVDKANRSTTGRLRKVGKEFDYFVIDKSDLFKDRKYNIFLNLTSLKLKRDQRNLERKDDTINLIRLLDRTKFADARLVSTANYLNENLTANYINISEWYNSLKQDDLNQQQLVADQQANTPDTNINQEAIAPTQTKDGITMVVSMSILYIIIFFTGVFGNLGKLN